MDFRKIAVFFFLLTITVSKAQENDVKANIEMDFFGNLYLDVSLPSIDLKKDTLIIDDDILIHKNYASLIGGVRINGSYLINYKPKDKDLSYVINLPKNSANSYVKKADYFFTFINYLPSQKQNFNKEKKFDITFNFPKKLKVVYPDSTDLTKKFITTPPIIAGDFVESEIEGFKVLNLKKDNKHKNGIEKVMMVVKDAYDFYQLRYPKKESKPKIIFLPFEGPLGGRTIRDAIVFDSSILNDTITLEKRLIAHEVAHLWWGFYGVNFDNQYLIEGIAEYMSLKYMEYKKETEYVKKSINKKHYHIEGLADGSEILSVKRRSTEENGRLSYDFAPLLFFNVEKDNNNLYDVLSEFYKLNEANKGSISISRLDSFLKKNKLSPLVTESILPDYFFIEDGEKLILKGINFTKNKKIDIEFTDNSDLKKNKTYSFSSKMNEYVFYKKDIKKAIIDPEYKVLQFSRLNDTWANNNTSVFSKNRYFPIEEIKPEVLTQSEKMLDYLFSKNNVTIQDVTCEDNLWLIEKIDKLKNEINKMEGVTITGASTLFKIGRKNQDRIDVKASIFSKKENTSKFIYFYLYYDKSLKYLQNFKLESELNDAEE